MHVAVSGIEQGLFILSPRLGDGSADFDGDGAADTTTYRDGTWYFW